MEYPKEFNDWCDRHFNHMTDKLKEELYQTYVNPSPSLFNTGKRVEDYKTVN